jgi:hypothetical protein
MVKREEKKKYKLTLTQTKILFLEDVKGLAYCENLFIKQPPIFFNTEEEMINYIKNLKCGVDYNLLTKYECEIIDNE